MILLFATLLLGASGSAGPLTTTDSWTLDQKPGRCSMAQHFKGTDGEIKLSIYQRVAAYDAVVIVEREMPERAEGRKGMVTITIDGHSSRAAFVASDMLGTRIEALRFIMAPEQLASLGRAHEVTIATDDGEDVDLAPSQLPAAFAMLRGCADRLLRRFDIDPAAEAKVAVPPERVAGDPWITSADYPKKARRAGEGGMSFVLWTVDAQGNATNCRTVTSSGTRLLDQTACNLIEQRGHYRPARDLAGNAVASHDSQAVFWFPVSAASNSYPYRRSGLEFLLNRTR